MDHITTDSLLATFNSIFTTKFKNSNDGQVIKSVLAGRSIRKNQKAPDFKVTDIEGKMLSLSDFKGKFIILNYWATWCAPCLLELPQITAIKSKYPESNLEYIYVSRDKGATKAFYSDIRKFNMVGRHIISDDDLTQLYGAQVIPKLYIIDPDGIIIYNKDEESDVTLTKFEQIAKEKFNPAGK